MTSKQPDPPGAAYRAVVRLTTKDRAVLAMPGELCTQVPASSLPWLIEQGLIEPAQKAEA